jgi:hypothetical protein
MVRPAVNPRRVFFSDYRGELRTGEIIASDRRGLSNNLK